MEDNYVDSKANFLSRFPLIEKIEYEWELDDKASPESIKTIFNGIHKTDKTKEIYVKQIRLYDISTNKLKKILKEIYFTYALQGKNYFPKNVQIMLSNDQKYIFIIFKDKNMTLMKLIKTEIFDYRSGKNKNLIKYIIYQISFGLYFLHSNNIIHGDIKPSNIIINGGGIVSIIDFDATIFNNEESTSYSLPYTSPEFLIKYSDSNILNSDNIKIDEKIDIWGLGVIMLELYCKKNQIFAGKNIRNKCEQLKHLFSKLGVNESFNISDYGNKNIVFKIDKEILDIINDKDAIDLLNNLITFYPNKRYTAKEILESEYLKEFKFESLDIRPIEYPFDYQEISNKTIDHKKFVELVKRLK